jgi:ribulose 1,5-bisphosphate synthetase/thiazole synthase
MKQIVIPSEKVPVIAEADICVGGGSCSGVFAAVRAARLGARVVIVKSRTGSAAILPHLSPADG